MSDTILKRAVGKKIIIGLKARGDGGVGGKDPEDLRPLGLVNIFKSGLIKGIWCRGQGWKRPGALSRHVSPSHPLAHVKTGRPWESEAGRAVVRLQPPDSAGDPEVTSFPHGPLLPRHKSQGPNSKAQGLGDNGEDQKNLWQQGNAQAPG